MTINPVLTSSTSLERYLPENDNSNYFKLSSIAQNIARYAGTAAEYLGAGGISGPYNELIAAQTEAQMQLMQVSLQSNLSRTEHETKMAVVRNVRVA